MAADLRTLLTAEELGLQLLGREDSLPPGALERSITWVHSSDLEDPTPFLTPGVVLLTTGSQFVGRAHQSRAWASAYVSRLAEAAVAGLGFGTEVVRAGTPQNLVDACATAGVPLFEVPYRTPFIAVAQASAAEASRRAQAERARTEAIRRAIAHAALRADGLTAILAEVSARLGVWAGLFDAAGRLNRQAPADGIEHPYAAALQTRVEQLLRQGRRAGVSLQHAGRSFALQTLGQSGRLTGVLALETAVAGDESGRDVADWVVAFAGLALERGADVNEARSLLRTGLLNELMAGTTTLTRQVSAQLWGDIPAEPVQVIVSQSPGTAPGFVEESLELLVQAAPGAVFFARHGGQFVIVTTTAGRPQVLAVLARFNARSGISAPSSYGHISRSVAEAQEALGRSIEGAVEYEALIDRGVIRLLVDDDRARALAAGVVGRLREWDSAHGTQLVDTARVWLQCGAENGAAAVRLGVHRHTVRTRIQLLEQVLGHQLDGFAARADLWTALIADGAEHGVHD